MTTNPQSNREEERTGSMIDLVLKMMAIPGRSGSEGKIAEFIVDALKNSGVQDSCIQFDTAHKKSPIGGEVGNLIVKLPGTVKGPRRLLMGHIDTVPLCVGSQPYVDGGVIRSRDKNTALGGDNRAGAAVVLNTWLIIAKQNLDHPPLTLFWPVQEEIGLVGARYVTGSKLGNPKLCFNWDGGLPNMAVVGATGDDHIDITVRGIASHAGAHPEDGVSAVVIASKAIAQLQEEGWLGLVQKGNQAGTSNIGVIHGGDATNVVMDQLTLRAEARSHKAPFRAKIVNAICKAFVQAAKGVTNAAGKRGSVEVEVRNKYEAFKLSNEEPVVQSAIAAIQQAGLEPNTRVSNGGLDANWMTAHGFPTVTLGCGQAGIHTVNEELSIEQFQQAGDIALILATGKA
ncbi:MAG: M20/M25/M40 family metallo-hydrolase [Planctomycetaceae bacterium]|nr:M20/M25/M40 family metallo-hydrolase [Planctomycetaceae bacterium]